VGSTAPTGGSPHPGPGRHDGPAGDVAGTRRYRIMRFDHPQVGELRLNREKLLVSGTERIMLVVYHPDAGTDDADKLALLASAMLTSAAPHSAIANEQDRHDASTTST